MGRNLPKGTTVEIAGLTPPPSPASEAHLVAAIDVQAKSARTRKRRRRALTAAAVLLVVNVALGVIMGRIGLWDAVVSPLVTAAVAIGATIFWTSTAARVLSRRFPQVGVASERAVALLSTAWVSARQALRQPAYQIVIAGWAAAGWAITLALNVVALVSSALGSVTKTVADMNPFGGGGDAGGGLRAAGSNWAAPLDIITHPLYLLLLVAALAAITLRRRTHVAPAPTVETPAVAVPESPAAVAGPEATPPVDSASESTPGAAE